MARFLSMPEGPEVETVVRSVGPRVRGRLIRNVEILSDRIRIGQPELAAGRRIVDVERRGKFIVLQLSAGFLTIHLGMTGKLLSDGARGPHTRAIITLDDGALVYDDSRM